jgi:FolB domain-containing protein
MDQIEIEALRLRCVIGCNPEERRDRSDVIIDLWISTDAQPAGISDELTDAWDYRAAVKRVIAAVETSECFTIEALATRVARILVAECGAAQVSVRVRKPGALRFADYAGIRIERTSEDFTGEAATA